MTTPLIGAHVKQDDPLAMAAATDADLVQIFMGDPQSWKKPPPREDAEAIKSSGVPVYVHSPYLVNLASPNPKIRIPSRKILQQCADAAETVGALAIIVATAIGLFAAIPAVVAYNRYTHDVDRLAVRYESFIEEFSNILQRQS